MKSAIDEHAVIVASAGRISEVIRSCDLSTPIPHLGRWNVRDLAAHLGGVHRWATRVITDRSMDGPSFTKSKLGGSELCDWFDAGVEDLLTAIRANDPADPCPNFNPGSPKTVGWWVRRQLHETVVHRWDTEHSVGPTTSIDPVVAADGIDEYLDVFVRTRGKQTLIAPLVLSTPRPPRQWTLVPAARPGRIDVVAGLSVHATSELTGPPDKLLLNLWGRLTISEAKLTIRGDSDVAASLSPRA